MTFPVFLRPASTSKSVVGGGRRQGRFFRLCLGLCLGLGHCAQLGGNAPTTQPEVCLPTKGGGSGQAGRETAGWVQSARTDSPVGFG